MGSVEKDQRRVWPPDLERSLSVGVSDSLLGYKWDFNQDMAAIGAGNISVVFGDFCNYVVRNVLGFTFIRFNELYMTNYQRAYRHSCALTESLAIRRILVPHPPAQLTVVGINGPGNRPLLSNRGHLC